MEEAEMSKRLLVLVPLLLMSAVPARAQCTGWPVSCTGIHPSTGTAVNPGTAAVLGGAYAVGETLGTLLFGDVDAAMPFEDSGVNIFNYGVSIYNANNRHDCAHAMPYFRQALPYLQKAHNAVPINISFNRNLSNLNGWISLCQSTAGLKPAKRVDTTTLVRPRPDTQQPAPQTGQQQAQTPQAKRCPNFGEPHTFCGASPGAAICCPTPSPHCAADLSGC
jgi:hypothetical protein